MTGRTIASALAASALIIAVLGVTPAGRAVARLVVPKNSVGTAQIRKSAVTAAKIKPGTLTPADFATLPLAPGPLGPKGDTGPQGPKGDGGKPGLSGREIVTDFSTLSTAR